MSDNDNDDDYSIGDDASVDEAITSLDILEGVDQDQESNDEEESALPTRRDAYTSNKKRIQKPTFEQIRSRLVHNAENHKTSPLMTKYEFSRIRGRRLRDLKSGALSYAEWPSEQKLSVEDIFNVELEQGVVPLIISRELPDSSVEYWRVRDLVHKHVARIV